MRMVREVIPPELGNSIRTIVPDSAEPSSLPAACLVLLFFIFYSPWDLLWGLRPAVEVA